MSTRQDRRRKANAAKGLCRCGEKRTRGKGKKGRPYTTCAGCREMNRIYDEAKRTNSN